MADNAENTGSKTAPTIPQPARTYTATDFGRAARRCAALQQEHPSWPQARLWRVVGVGGN